MKGKGRERGARERERESEKEGPDTKNRKRYVRSTSGTEYSRSKTQFYIRLTFTVNDLVYVLFCFFDKNKHDFVYL